MKICHVVKSNLNVFADSALAIVLAASVIAGCAVLHPAMAQDAAQPEVLAPSSDALLAPAAPAPAATPTPKLAAPAGTLAPPGSAQTMLEADDLVAQDSALPAGGDLAPRSPGMELPVGDAMAGGLGDGTGTPPQRSEADIQTEIREDAFNAALTGLLPLEPPEIRKVLERYDRTLEASEIPIYAYPEPEIVVKNVSLDPGVRPVEIKLATGHVTTLNVVDVSGAPWPIQDVTWAGNFEIVQPEPGGHVVRITPMSEFAYGNISVRLSDLKTPITFILKAHRDTVYYRIDARLPEYGPLATPPIIDGGITIAAGSATMTSVLDGAAPEAAKKLDVTGVDGRTTAFEFNGLVYVRTPLTLLSPAWTGSIKSADGMNVYTLERAPVLLLSEQGRMVRARLSEKDKGL